MNSNKRLINSEIELFYERASEESRLEKGMGIFEFERTRLLISRYLLSPSSTIIDVGGGTGKYAAWLAEQGHQVYLVEPVLKHLKIAQKRANKLKNRFSIQQGEARRLKFPDNYADLIILHGPLYHLQDQQHRNAAIAEAKRVLKTDGIILGFAINYTASTLVGLIQGLIHKKDFFSMCKTELKTGLHYPPDDFPWMLARAYYHRPEELKQEFIDQQLSILSIHAVEGMAWLHKDYFRTMLDNQKRKTLLELIDITEQDSQLLSFSPHMMLAAQKKTIYGK